MRNSLVWAALCALAASPLAAQESRPQVWRGATLIPISGAPIPNGTLVVRDGRIVAVGGANLPIPAGAVVHDAAGKTIMPGLVDTHSHVGGGDGGDNSAALHPSVRILDAIDADDAGLMKARAGGITTVNVMPGSGLLLSGQTAYLKLRPARTVYDLLLCRDPAREICGGIKMANGTNPRRDAPLPGTRARAAAMMRERFVKAQEYRAKLRTAGADSAKRPARDLELEGLAEVLDGRRSVHFHSHRADDILTALRLGREFGFTPVLHHVSEGWKVAREIAAARAPASVIVIDAPGGKPEAYENRLETGAMLQEAGALVAFHTDDGITDSRWFLRQAGLAVRAGMQRDAALRAMTVHGARIMGLEERVGTLQIGKDADFVVLSGDPLSVYTHVEQTWVEGRKVFDRADPRHREYAVGGPNAYPENGAHLHHEEESQR